MPLLHLTSTNKNMNCVSITSDHICSTFKPTELCSLINMMKNYQIKFTPTFSLKFVFTELIFWKSVFYNKSLELNVSLAYMSVYLSRHKVKTKGHWHYLTCRYMDESLIKSFFLKKKCYMILSLILYV